MPPTPEFFVIRVDKPLELGTIQWARYATRNDGKPQPLKVMDVATLEDYIKQCQERGIAYTANPRSCHYYFVHTD